MLLFMSRLTDRSLTDNVKCFYCIVGLFASADSLAELLELKNHYNTPIIIH